MLTEVIVVAWVPARFGSVAVTVSVHGARLATLLRTPRTAGADAAPGFQLPEIESASGVLVHEK